MIREQPKRAFQPGYAVDEVASPTVRSIWQVSSERSELSDAWGHSRAQDVIDGLDTLAGIGRFGETAFQFRTTFSTTMRSWRSRTKKSFRPRDRLGSAPVFARCSRGVHGAFTLFNSALRSLRYQPPADGCHRSAAPGV